LQGIPYKVVEGSGTKFYDTRRAVMDNQQPITRAEHLEFAKRQDEENHRQNKRIDALEETVRQIGTLATSVEKLAVSMESMVKEQEQQGKRLETLEQQNGQMEVMHNIDLLTSSIEKITLNMANLIKEQENQKKQLESLESRDGEKWRKVTAYVITSIISIVIGYIFSQIGM